MGGLLHAIETFPGALYTVLLGLVLLYWVSVVIGAVDLDALGGAEHGAEGAAKGMLDGAGKALFGAVDGAAEGVTQAAEAAGGVGSSIEVGTMEAGVDAAGHGAGGEGVDGGDGIGADIGGEAGASGAHGGGVLSALGGVHLRKVPVTVAGSLVVIYGWLVTVLAQVTAGLALERLGLPGWVLGTALLVVSMIAAVRFAGWTVRPLVPLFATRPAQTRADLLGKDAVVTTGRLDATFGQVSVIDGGAGLLLDARFDGGTLRRGERVVVSHWDAERNVVVVEPLDRFARVRMRADASAAAPSGVAPTEAQPKSVAPRNATKRSG